MIKYKKGDLLENVRKTKIPYIKHLKEKFKEDIYKTGIYIIKITNKIDLFYIGFASMNKARYNCCKGFYCRWRIHLNDFRKNSHSNRFLQRIYNKYGIDVFEFSILEFCEPEKCPDLELKYIENLKPKLNLYGNKYCLVKEKVSKETRLKISNSLKGRTHTEETKLKIKLAHCSIDRKFKLSISEEILIEIKKEIESGKTRNFLKFKYNISVPAILNNLKHYFKDNSLIEKLKNNKPNYNQRKKPIIKKPVYPIEEILNLYRKGYLISQIRKEINLNEDLIGKLIKNNMSLEEHKIIRSRNAKRK